MMNYQALEGPNVAEALRAYRYRSVDSSIGSRVLDPFWECLAGLLPPWLAPNTITLFATLGILAAYIVNVWVCPTISEVAPRWLSLLNFVALFFYQTADALDGKQARRTRSSSPLGDCMDHSCDAVASTVILLLLGTSLRAGDSIFLISLHCSLLTAFYVAHFQAMRMGALVFAEVDVIEAQLGCMALFLFSACVQHAPYHFVLFTATIPGFGSVSLKLLHLILGISIAFTSRRSISSSRDISRGDKWYPLYLAQYLVAISATYATWAFARPTQRHLVFLISNFTCAGLIVRVIVARLTKAEPRTSLYVLAPIVACAGVAVYTRRLCSVFFVAATLVTAFSYVHFLRMITRRFCEALGIRCFSIQARN